MDKAKFIDWLKSDSVQILSTEAEFFPGGPPGLRMFYVVFTHPAEHTFEGMAEPVVVVTRTLTDEEKKQIQDGWEADEEAVKAAVNPPVRMLREEEQVQDGWAE